MAEILYLHGFNSSPQSVKARQTAEWLQRQGLSDRFHCPSLPYSPQSAASVIETWFLGRDASQVSCIGSSLGGFYATWAAERFGCRAALINPAVRPHTHLENLLGPQRNLYTGEQYTLELRHMDELLALQPAGLHPERYWLLVETADETLDYREAVAYYRGARQTVIEGGDHSFQHWPQLLPQVMDWAGLTPG